jgi:hypothetical protein
VKDDETNDFVLRSYSDENSERNQAKKEKENFHEVFLAFEYEYEYYFQIQIRKLQTSKLVDPASDHILRSKIKPCMSKTKQVTSESAYGSLYELSLTPATTHKWITFVIQGLIMHPKWSSNRPLHLLVSNQHSKSGES